MSYTQTLTIGVAGSGVNLSGTYTVSADGRWSYDFELPASASNVQLDVAFSHARLKSFVMKSSQDVVVETNSTSEPGDTLNVAAGQPFPWVEGMPYDKPFTENVTTFYLSNESTTAAARVQLEILYDPTP